MDVETGPDADTPRPCGLALLLCMIERDRVPAETALVGYAARLQVGSACPAFNRTLPYTMPLRVCQRPVAL